MSTFEIFFLNMEKYMWTIIQEAITDKNILLCYPDKILHVLYIVYKNVCCVDTLSVAV